MASDRLSERDYVDFAKCLCAAYPSHRMKLKSIDYALKRYVERTPGKALLEETFKTWIGTEAQGPTGAA
jgi:hypothetical protein